MQNPFTKMVIGIAISAVAMYAADNSLGTWKRNMEKSKSSAPSGPTSVKNSTMVREAATGGVKVTSTGERMNGEPINGSYTVKYDGKEYPAIGMPFDIVSAKQINANTITSETKKTAGPYHSTSRTVISNGGKTLTLTSKGINAEGKAITATTVYDKQ